MSFLKNIACPSCRKQGRDRHGDNLATYSDGGMYCWSCGYGKKGIARRPQEAIERPMEAFSRWTKVLPPHHMENLLERGFKPLELTEFVYDPIWDRRVYPVYSGQELVFYEARHLTAQPKSIQRGEKPLRILGAGERLVFVEDLLSAIKVARYERAAPLWGSSLVKDWIPHLIGLGLPVTFWLDRDKFKESIKMANTLSLVGLETHVISTDDDPKDLTDEQITGALYGSQA